MTLQRTGALWLVAGLAAAVVAPAVAQLEVSESWNIDGDGDWSNANNWTNNRIPNGELDVATFGAISAARTINVDTFVTLNWLKIDSANTYRFVTGANRTLRLAALDVLNANGKQIIEPTIVTKGPNLQVNVASAAEVGLEVRGITGDGGFVKRGDGTMMISGACNYAGNTRVSGGKLIINNQPCLPEGTKLAVDTGGTLVMQGFQQTVAELSGAGVISGGNGARQALTVNQATDSAFSGKLKDGLDLVKKGTGTLKLSGTNTHRKTEILGGTIELGSNTALPEGGEVLMENYLDMKGYDAKIAVTSRGVNATIYNSAAAFSNLTVTRGSYEGKLQDKINFIVKGNVGDVFDLGGRDDKTFTGTQTIESGTLRLTGAGSILPEDRILTVRADGVFDLNGRGQGFSGLAGTGTITDRGGDLGIGDVRVRVPEGETSTFDGRIRGRAQMQKSGPGTLVLNGASDHTGGTTVYKGTLTLSPTANGAATIGGKIKVEEGILDGNGRVGDLVTVDTAGALKGKLKLDKGFKNNGGTIGPGYSAGTITCDGAIEFSNGGRYEWELSSPTTDGAGENYDLIDVRAGAITISADSIIKLSFAEGVVPNHTESFWQAEHDWIVIRAAGADQNDGEQYFRQVWHDQFDEGEGSFSTFVRDGNVVLHFTPQVPAPGVLLVTGLSGLCFARRKR